MYRQIGWNIVFLSSSHITSIRSKGSLDYWPIQNISKQYFLWLLTSSKLTILNSWKQCYYLSAWKWSNHDASRSTHHHVMMRSQHIRSQTKGQRVKVRRGNGRGGSRGVLIACCSCQSSPWLQCEKGWQPMRVDGSSGSLARSGFHRIWGQICSNQKRLSTFYGKYNPNTMM